MMDKPIHTLKEWDVIRNTANDRVPEILRDWGRRELILKEQIIDLEDAISLRELPSVQAMEAEIARLDAVIERLGDDKMMVQLEHLEKWPGLPRQEHYYQAEIAARIQYAIDNRSKLESVLMNLEEEQEVDL